MNTDQWIKSVFICVPAMRLDVQNLIEQQVYLTTTEIPIDD